MWEELPADEFVRKLRRWPKKHKRELAAMLSHVEVIVMALQDGAKVEHLDFGFVHHEPGGVLALDQRGGGSGLLTNAPATRQADRRKAGYCAENP
jgi:hypothetical protein